MILAAAEDRLQGHVLENGCGIGMYVEHLSPHAGRVTGLEFDFDRAREAQQAAAHLGNAGIICAAGENLPVPDESIDLILSHEVLEHVRNDRQAACEMVRAVRPGGRIIVFVPNRGYPFETHGVYWRGRYRFGNIPLVNYLPMSLRNRLAPHVRVYDRKLLTQVFSGLPVKPVQRTVIFGAYDNIIARRPTLGRLLRSVLQLLERTPARILGLSHFWVLERVESEVPAGNQAGR